MVIIFVQIYSKMRPRAKTKILIEISPALASDCLNNYSSHAIKTLIKQASSE